ncbi:phage tail terminator-like protein [Halomonas pacifica]|uniref:phage tail terminator-like protein n=1 Tax=Bisbaumannia pacifica TaxID=77098 RepID=UPI0023589E92|nr:phage tail terminator-like protein [Halomonas pacifica]MDC8803940.1 phage tail terminator-like protein [Halomonas pacifica]
MTYLDIVATLIKRLREWPGPESLEIPNMEPPPRTPNWMRATILPGSTVPFETGCGPIPRQTGLVMIQVFTELGRGPGPAYDIATRIGEHMAYQTIGNLFTRAYSPQDFGEMQGWYQVNVSIPYVAQ